jgi:hypothetical protein
MVHTFQYVWMLTMCYLLQEYGKCLSRHSERPWSRIGWTEPNWRWEFSYIVVFWMIIYEASTQIQTRHESNEYIHLCQSCARHVSHTRHTFSLKCWCYIDSNGYHHYFVQQFIKKKIHELYIMLCKCWYYCLCRHIHARQSDGIRQREAVDWMGTCRLQ